MNGQKKIMGRLRVDYYCKETVKALWLARRGMSIKAIAQKAKLTPCQVAYRMYGNPDNRIRLRDFRDGVSPEAVEIEAVFEIDFKKGKIRV